MIKWFDIDKKNKNCIATIYDTNITLNKHACDLISTAYTVMLGLDYDNKMLFIKPLNISLKFSLNTLISFSKLIIMHY